MVKQTKATKHFQKKHLATELKQRAVVKAHKAKTAQYTRSKHAKKGAHRGVGPPGQTPSSLTLRPFACRR